MSQLGHFPDYPVKTRPREQERRPDKFLQFPPEFTSGSRHTVEAAPDQSGLVTPDNILVHSHTKEQLEKLMMNEKEMQNCYSQRPWVPVGRITKNTLLIAPYEVKTS